MGNSESRLFRNFDVQQILGYGAFGVVLKARHQLDEVAYAVKLVQLPARKEDAARVKLEAVHFGKIPSHQNVVCYKTSWIDTLNPSDCATFAAKLGGGKNNHPDFRVFDTSSPLNFLCIKMELCSGTLRNYINLGLKPNPEGIDKNTNPRKSLRYFLQICEGLEHIHKQNIVHRDIKPDNIFFCASDPNIVKIGDLGISKFIQQKPINSLRQNQFMTTTGTIAYMAPEQSTGKYGKQVDIYSLGIILFELICPIPYNRFERTISEVKLYKKFPQEFEKHPELCQLSKRLIDNEPKRRPSLDEVCTSVKKAHKNMQINSYFSSREATHNGVVCDGCQQKPLKGKRFKCRNCPAFDYCQKCHDQCQTHDTTHTFFLVECCETCEKTLNIPKVGNASKYYRCIQCSGGSCRCEKCFGESVLHASSHDFIEIFLDPSGQEMKMGVIPANSERDTTSHRSQPTRTEMLQFLMELRSLNGGLENGDR